MSGGQKVGPVQGELSGPHVGNITPKTHFLGNKFLGVTRLNRPVRQPEAQRNPENQCSRHRRDQGIQHPVASPRFSKLVCRGGWPGEDGLVGPVSFQVRRQIKGGVVASLTILLEALHDDPIQIGIALSNLSPGLVGRSSGTLVRFADTWMVPGARTASFRRFRSHRSAVRESLPDPRARACRLPFPDDPAHFIETTPGQFPDVKRGHTGKQFVEQDAKAVNVAPGIDAFSVCSGLM